MRQIKTKEKQTNNSNKTKTEQNNPKHPKARHDIVRHGTSKDAVEFTLWWSSISGHTAYC